MVEPYYIVFNPFPVDLMHLIGKVNTPLDVLDQLGMSDGSLDLPLVNERVSLTDIFGIEGYAPKYIADTIATLRPSREVVLADGKRRTLSEIIEERGDPVAVLISSMSLSFPSAVLSAINLNHRGIPTIFGGIHVSASQKDVETFVKPYVQKPELVSQCLGPGDFATVERILDDLDMKELNSEYRGKKSIEDGVWRNHGNVIDMDPLRMSLVDRFPIVGGLMKKHVKVHPIPSKVGCPYSCSFCAIGPKELRELVTRDPQDFIGELTELQGTNPSLLGRMFYFLSDNIILAPEATEELMVRIIESDVKLNFLAQISIDVASDPIIDKLRLAGCSHAFIGLESLEPRDLIHIGKPVLAHIRKYSGKSNSNLTRENVEAYYSEQIRRYQDKGISVHASFITGLPNAWFESLHNHVGVEVADFCVRNRIAMQPAVYTALPGAKDYKRFRSSLLYGSEEDSIDSFLALSLVDITETNLSMPDGFLNSSLVSSYVGWHASRLVARDSIVARNAVFMFGKAWGYPTKQGRETLRDRLADSLISAVYQIGLGQYFDHVNSLAMSTEGRVGTFERLYEEETNPQVKKMFSPIIDRFRY